MSHSWDTPNRQGVYDRILCEVCNGTGSYTFPRINECDNSITICCPSPKLEGMVQCQGRGYIVKEQTK